MPNVSKGAHRFYKMRTERLYRAVPTLDLRRKQLSRELLAWEEAIEALARRREALTLRMRENPHPEVERIVSVERIDTAEMNIAGVALKKVRDVAYRIEAYSFLMTQPSFDFFVELKKEVLKADAELDVMKRSLAVLVEELTITTQRINLFEKRLIPQYVEQMRYIRGRLEDNERASVMVAKIAQREMLLEQSTAESA